MKSIKKTSSKSKKALKKAQRVEDLPVVKVVDGNLDAAIRKLNRIVATSRVMRILRARSLYPRPGARRRYKKSQWKSKQKVAV